MDKNSIYFILDKKYRKGDIVIKSKTISITQALMVFSFYNYSDALTLEYFKSFYSRAESARGKLKAIYKLFKEHDIDISTYQRKKTSSNKKISKPKTDSEKIISKLSPFLDVFNINKESLGKALNGIKEGTSLSQEAILESYKTLYLILMENAKGSIVTKKTSISYTLEDNNKGGYNKHISKNSNGEMKMFEETQSHLPDPKSFAMAMVVMEVIERMEQGDRAYATDDELNDMYSDFLKDKEEEKLAYKDKDYTDIEVV